MVKKLNIKKVIANNPAIDEKEFRKTQKLLEERKKTSVTRVGYNILPPFTTKRQIKTSK